MPRPATAWDRAQIDLFRQVEPSTEFPVRLAKAVRASLRMPYVYSVMPSPVGALKLVASGQGLSAVLWENDDPLRVRLGESQPEDEHPVLVEARRQLSEYFAGRRRSFSVELDFRGTPFQCRVWQALLTIPFGETRSYGQIATQIGSPSAVRAVGAANGRNPISIVAPCHRVIGASGKLTGFAGGLAAKDFLLRLEGRRDLLDRDALPPPISPPAPAAP